MTKHQAVRVDQFLPTFSARDAIGIEVNHINTLLQKRGLESEIFVEKSQKSLAQGCQKYLEYQRVKQKYSIIIYHYSIGSELPYYLSGTDVLFINRYHNITPPHFLNAYGHSLTSCLCEQGLRQKPYLRKITDLCWAVSKYNAHDLAEGTSLNHRILPLIRDYETLVGLKKVPSLLDKCSDNKKNILFVGRVAPNKAIHDLIFSFKLFRDNIDKNVRLLVVGDLKNIPPYIKELEKISRQLDLTCQKYLKKSALNADIILAGSVTDEEMAMFYRKADLFLCLSDHEGFCVPVVEAMNFGVPVISHASTALPETIQGGGIMVDKKNIGDLLGGMRAVLHYPDFRNKLVEKGRLRAREFCFARLEKLFNEYLDEALNMVKNDHTN